LRFSIRKELRIPLIELNTIPIVKPHEASRTILIMNQSHLIVGMQQFQNVPPPEGASKMSMQRRQIIPGVIVFPDQMNPRDSQLIEEFMQKLHE